MMYTLSEDITETVENDKKTMHIYIWLSKYTHQEVRHYKLINNISK